MIGTLLLCLLAADPSAWWESYGDPVLSRLVARAVERNPDVRIAAERLAEARALSRDARSAQMPAVNLNSSAQRIRGGFQNGIIRITPGAAPGSGTALISAFETGLLAGSLDTRWELSFWSGTAKRFSAAKADVEADKESLEDLRLIARL